MIHFNVVVYLQTNLWSRLTLLGYPNKFLCNSGFPMNTRNPYNTLSWFDDCKLNYVRRLQHAYGDLYYVPFSVFLYVHSSWPQKQPEVLPFQKFPIRDWWMVTQCIWHVFDDILCLWFRALLIYINNCPTRCNTKLSIYYSASSLYMFRVSTTPIIRSTQNCNYILRYRAATSLQRDELGHVGGRWLHKKIWPVPEAVLSVLCTPDDGWVWHPKHVEWTCRI